MGRVESNSKYYQANKHKLLEPQARYKNAQSLAKSRKREFNLTFEHYAELIAQPCHYCHGKLGQVQFAMGLDRIDNQMGYVFGNILPCCHFCNMVRGKYLSVRETEVAM
ncbi:MAG: hypothetical protein ACREBJ_00140 [Nitrosotalea sp.]